MPNIEIKAHYPDLEKARNICRRINAQHLGLDHQVDTYFYSKEGRLKLRESTLSGAMLIPYLRNDLSGPKKSQYALLPCPDPTLTKNLFSKMLGIETIVEKYRDIFLIDNVRVHLDDVKGLGLFLEFEAVYQDESKASEEKEFRKVQDLLQVFEIGPKDLIQGSYRERSADL